MLLHQIKSSMSRCPTIWQADVRRSAILPPDQPKTLLKQAIVTVSDSLRIHPTGLVQGDGCSEILARAEHYLNRSEHDCQNLITPWQFNVLLM